MAPTADRPDQGNHALENIDPGHPGPSNGPCRDTALRGTETQRTRRATDPTIETKVDKYRDDENGVLDPDG